MNEAREFATAVFSAVDLRDAEKFSKFFARDGLFVFGNAEPVRGRDAIAASVGGFFSSIAGLKHHIADVWQLDDVMIITNLIDYTRWDGRIVRQLPCANVLRLDGGLIADYRIYMDIGPVFAP